MRQVKTQNQTLCLPTQNWLTGYAWYTQCHKIQRYGGTKALEEGSCAETSPGMSIQLGYWRQNEGVSGTDPSSSHVHPAEIIY